MVYMFELQEWSKAVCVALDACLIEVMFDV